MTTQVTSSVGMMVERIQVEQNAPVPIAISTLTRATNTATVTTAVPHNFAQGDYVTIAGAVPGGYNGKFKITVAGPTTFTYVVASTTLATPATGTMTATYVSDSMGGQEQGWTAVGGLIAAELMPGLRSWEVLQNSVLQSEMDYRFRIYRRTDITTSMRVQWTPGWPPNAPKQTLAIGGILLEGDGRRFMVLECKGA